jgi:hypothetical protein
MWETNSKGAIAEAIDKFSISRRTIGGIWKRDKECMQYGTVSIDMSSNIKEISGRKKKDRDALLKKIAQVPSRLRFALRSMLTTIKEPLKMIYRVFKEGKLRRVSNTLKPRLTKENKLR